VTESKRSARQTSARKKRGGVHARTRSPRLQESSEQFRLAQEQLGIVTWVWDVASDRVKWHGNMAGLLGLARGAFSGRFAEYLACLHPEDLEAARQTYTDCLRGRRREYRAVERVIWPDESVHWLETYGRAEYAADGKALRMMGVIKEISELKEQEERERQARVKYDELSAERLAAERRFTALFESSPIGLIVTRPRDRRVVEINDVGLQILGLAREEAIGVPTVDLATILDRERFEDLRTRALAGERGLNGELAVVRRDGRPIDLLLSTALVQLEGEDHFVVSIVDVTLHRATERERAVADARYRTLFQSAHEGMVITTPSHVMVDVNPAACALTGFAAQELVGQSAVMLYSEQDLRRQPFRTDLTRRWHTIERVLTRKDGRRLEVEVAAGPMPDGNILAIVRDITERKRSETLLMNVARGVSAEVGGAFFRSLVGHLARELGADFAFIGELMQPGNDRVRTLAFLADGAIVDNAEYRLEGSPCVHALNRRGTVIYPERVAELFPGDTGLKRRSIEAYVGTSLIGAGGAILGVLVVMHRTPVQRGSYWASMIEIFAARAAAEIERSRAEALVRRTNASLEQIVQERTAQLEEANRELESYNFSISHDLRQPLNAIAGFSELLRERGSAAGAQEYLREIESNAARMEQMIEALLRLSRAGRGTLRRAPVDCGELVQQVLHDLSVSTPLAAAVEVGELPPANADPVLLRQVWSNLIGNAAKYSRNAATPRIQVTGTRRAGTVEYEVRDNGVGFDMRHATRLFGAFQRLPTAAAFEGSGVGLAIVERIVRRHGGRISAESEPGRGATFRFTISDQGM
jgi:PAS domain S-box-containing protein